MILDEFSKARAARCHATALYTTSRLTNAQAWGIFLHVYKDIIRLLVSGLSLEVDPHDATHTYANPATDFRVLGIKVFKDTIFDRYRLQM